MRPSTASAPGPLGAPPASGAAESLGRLLSDLRTDERRLDRFVRRASSGCPMEPGEMLAAQSLVYRYSQRVDLLAKLVERATGAVRQTLQTQL